MNEYKVREAIMSHIADLRSTAITIREKLRLENTAAEMEKAANELESLFAPQPERICGLTMDEWQVVIDGGYLCEFTGSEGEIRRWRSALSSIRELCRFDAPWGSSFEKCKPYRAAGHVQPYFADSPECKAYLDGLSDDALIHVHFATNNFWGERRGGDLQLVDVDKFIVLSE